MPIWYNITSQSELTVGVTFKGSSSSEYSNEYSGVLCIPATVNYKGTIYSITSIYDYAFYNCTGLTCIYSLNSTAPICTTNAFNGVNSSIPIYIPKGAINNYYWEEGWVYFDNFIEERGHVGVEEEKISTSEIKVIAGSGININEYYGNIRIVNLSGQVVKDFFVNGSAQICLPKGIYIVVTNNKSQKIVL